MIVIHYLCILFYVCQLSVFTYSKVIARQKQSSSADAIKCSPNDLLCFKNQNKQDSRNSFLISDSYVRIDLSSDYADDMNTMNDEIGYGQVLAIGDYVSKESEYDFSVKSSTGKVKRALELVEEYPPEATARPPYNDGENLTARPSSSIPAMPSMPSMPSIPSMPSMPSMPSVPSMPSMPPMPKPPTISTLDPKNSVDVTTSPNVELLETTTEDYGNIGEPNCEYDPFSFVLKCSINLITSIFGLSDTCCKPLL